LFLAVEACQNFAMRRRARVRSDGPGAVFRRIAAKLGLKLNALGHLLGYSPRQMTRFVRHPTGRATPRLRRALAILALRDRAAAEELAAAYRIRLDVPASHPTPAAAPSPSPAPSPPLLAVAVAARDALKALGDALVVLAERSDRGSTSA
jgi:hypothetical protein